MGEMGTGSKVQISETTLHEMKDEMRRLRAEMLWCEGLFDVVVRGELSQRQLVETVRGARSRLCPVWSKCEIMKGKCAS